MAPDLVATRVNGVAEAIRTLADRSTCLATCAQSRRRSHTRPGFSEPGRRVSSCNESGHERWDPKRWPRRTTVPAPFVGRRSTCLVRSRPNALTSRHRHELPAQHIGSSDHLAWRARPWGSPVGERRKRREARMAPDVLRGPILLAVVALVVLSACGRNETAAPPTTTTTTPAPSSSLGTTTTTEATTTTVSVDATEQAVLAAYDGYFDAILKANDPPDQSSPVLREYATGEAFQSVFEAAQANRLAGRSLRLPEGSVTEHRAEVISIEGGEATVRDCAVDDVLVVRTDTGEVLNDAVATQLRTATLIQEEGSWKVSFTELEERWEGIAGCALED